MGIKQTSQRGSGTQAETRLGRGREVGAAWGSEVPRKWQSEGLGCEPGWREGQDADHVAPCAAPQESGFHPKDGEKQLMAEVSLQKVPLAADGEGTSGTGKGMRGLATIQAGMGALSTAKWSRKLAREWLWRDETEGGATGDSQIVDF